MQSNTQRVRRCGAEQRTGDDAVLRADYLRHERIYAEKSGAHGWNDAAGDREILTYVHELLRQAHIFPPATIMELGCGMGNLSLPLAGAGFHVAGVDISPTAIAVAARRSRETGRSASFYVRDVTAEGAFVGLDQPDCILDGLCWHCIVGQDRRPFLAAVRAALRRDGCFLAISMCGDPRSARLKARFDPVSRCITDGLVAERYLGQPHDLAAELRQAGFEIQYHRVVAGNDETGDQDMFLAVARAC